MGLFLMRFWPVLIPLLLYTLWFYTVGRKITIDGKPAARFRDGPWYWLVLMSLGIGVGCLLMLGNTVTNSKGAYTPPHLKDGKMVEGSVKPVSTP